MRVTMHQPEHLPWLGYFHKMAQADLYVVMDDFQYRHQYFQNRNRILGVEGSIWVTAHVRKERHRYGAIRDVRLDDSRAWRKTYWGSISYHYRKHPHYERYAPALEAILTAPTDSLLSLNMALIAFFREALAIRTPMIRCSSLGVSGANSALIHQVCLAVGADTYLSGPTGRDYLDESLFEASGLAVEYHAFAHPRYPQKSRTGFTPQLSTLDLLMNCGPESRAWLLEGVPLIALR